MFRDLFQQSGLSLERLHTFCTVVEAGGISKAASGDPNAQSLFSRQIKELEEYFGVELVRRSGRGVVLTSHGKRLAVVVRECLSSLDDFRVECAGTPQRITIAAGDSLMRWLVLPRLKSLRGRLANVSFVFLNLQSDDILRRIHEGTVDFGLVRDTGTFPTLRRAPLGTLSHALFTASKAGTRETFEKVLMNQPLATLEGEGVFRRELARALSAAGLRARVQLECSSFSLVAAAAQNGDVAAILPDISATELPPEHFRRISSPVLKSLDRKIAFVWNDRTLRLRACLGKTKDFLQGQLKF
ncbi:MAG: LysR family transcriptional regulator [Verrucomicrobia bacterium]|nr:LysR family transcriptional regulator [Verrucomicrobiota bacterium]